jgi:nucleoid-associated protein YgaU
LTVSSPSPAPAPAPDPTPPPAPVIPSPAPAPAPTPAAPAPQAAKDHTVESGDTFSCLAKKYFNDENKWALIAQVNPGVDSSRLKIGQVIKIPTDLDAMHKQREQQLQAVAQAAGSGTAQTVEIRNGDTLYGISKRIYGSGAHWKTIYEANRDQLKNPEQTLQVGMRLNIPPKPAKP